MRSESMEATALARLYSHDPVEVIGWLYVWNTKELAIRCADRAVAFCFISTPVDLSQFPLKFQSNMRVQAKLASTKPLPSRIP